MRIVVTGHKGQLGTALQRVLTAEELLGLDLPEHNITDPASIIDTIVSLAPDMVIHGAAMTDVDGCERDPDMAFRVNALGTQNIALACTRCGATMVHLSTNDVFDGSLGRPYYEWDTPSPKSVYGRSKAAAEFHVRTLLNRFYIVRTAWLYARGGNNFVTKIIAAADKHGALRVVTDEVSAPTYAPDLAGAIARLIHTEHYGSFICQQWHLLPIRVGLKILQLSVGGHPRRAHHHRPVAAIAPPPLYAPVLNFTGRPRYHLRPWEDAWRSIFPAMNPDPILKGQPDIQNNEAVER